MGKRILLVWEIGAGEGHLLKLGWIARALRARGHEVLLATSPSRALKTQDTYGTTEILPAPVWPGQADNQLYRLPGRTTGLADDLWRLGLGATGAFERLLREWDQLLAKVKPDVLIGDAAPACLAAAYGRIPSVAIGTGFTLPPAVAGQFGSIDPEGRPPQVEETSLLDAANTGLRATGRASLRCLPELYRADRTCVGTFAEFDPYGDARENPVATPWLPEWTAATSMRREEIFCYLSFNIAELRTLLIALAQVAALGVPVRVYIPRADPETARWLETRAIRLAPKPLPLNEIQSCARLVISFGSLGFVSFALAAGIPQIVIPHSLSHEVTGRIVAKIGAGHSFKLDARSPLEADLLAQAIHHIFSNDEPTERSKSLAPGFMRRTLPRTPEVTAAMVDELL